MKPAPGVSVLILTLNEEHDLVGCLKTVAWSDDVHVFDSMSTDRTVELARDAGAHVSQRAYPGTEGPFGGDEAAHRNWALRNIDFRHEWVLQIDADERVTPVLRDSIMAAVADPGECVAFEMRRRDFLNGRWLRHVQATPYYVRLFRPECMRFERRINFVPRVDGAVGRVAGYLDHYPFGKGISWWITRHNAYSTLEAVEIIAALDSGDKPSLARALRAGSLAERRVEQKRLFYAMPARPLLKFVLLYIAKGGFLDGGPGLTYSLLQSTYEYLIVLKTRELRGR